MFNLGGSGRILLIRVRILIFRLNRYDFLFLAELIKTIFPQEPKEIYYSVAKFGQKAAGKLYDAYNNYRKKLSQSGFLKRRAYISKAVNSAVILGK